MGLKFLDLLSLVPHSRTRPSSRTHHLDRHPLWKTRRCTSCFSPSTLRKTSRGGSDVIDMPDQQPSPSISHPWPLLRRDPVTHVVFWLHSRRAHFHLFHPNTWETGGRMNKSSSWRGEILTGYPWVVVSLFFYKGIDTSHWPFPASNTVPNFFFRPLSLSLSTW